MLLCICGSQYLYLNDSEYRQIQAQVVPLWVAVICLQGKQQYLYDMDTKI